jgi:tetratricopeptide (TPR) repeat protein
LWRCGEEPGTLAVDVRQLLAEIPDEAREAYDEAVGLLENGERPEGIALLERAVALAPDYYEALNRLGVEYFAQGRFRDAEAVITRAADLNRNDPVPLMNLGVLRYHEGRSLEDREAEGPPNEAEGDSSTSFQQAVEAFEATLRLEPTSATAAYYLGMSLHKTGNPERAEGLLLEALDRDPSLSDARLTLIGIYLEQDRRAAALEQITAYLDESPEAANRESLEQIRDTLEAEP